MALRLHVWPASTIEGRLELAFAEFDTWRRQMRISSSIMMFDLKKTFKCMSLPGRMHTQCFSFFCYMAPYVNVSARKHAHTHMRLNDWPRFGGKGYDTAALCMWLHHARLFMHAWKSTHAADMIILTEVTPSDLLGLLRWVMNAIDIYFRAVNVKGRRWIPATEARGLVQHCHNMTDSCQLTHRIC